MGVEVHFFTGNHDIWCDDYLTKECGVTIHREPVTTEIYGKEFYLAHGDGLGDPDKSSSCYVLCSIVVRYRLCSLRFIPDGALTWD